MMETNLAVVNFVQNRCGVSYEVADPMSLQLKEDKSIEFMSTKSDSPLGDRQFSLHRLIERLDMAEKRRQQILDRRTSRLKSKRQHYRHFLHERPDTRPPDKATDKDDTRHGTSAFVKDKTASSVAFEIILDDSATDDKCIKEFNLARAKSKNRRQLTIEDIEKKLQIAEVRRKKYEERRIQRVKARQNAVRSIARNVELLMELRAAYPHVAPGKNQRNHLVKTDTIAKRTSQSFNELKHKTIDCDLAIPSQHGLGIGHAMDDDQARNNLTSTGSPSLVVRDAKAKEGFLSYSIEFEGDSPEKCASPPPANLKRFSPFEKRQTKEELERKLQKAEERRQKRLAERSRRAAASREALLVMANKIDIILDHQSPSFNVLLKQTALFGKRLSGLEIRQMAADVAEGFEAITERYQKDIDLARTLEETLTTD